MPSLLTSVHVIQAHKSDSPPSASRHAPRTLSATWCHDGPAKPTPPAASFAAAPEGHTTISLDPAAHRQFLRHLDGFIRDSKKILDAWDVYSDEHTGLDGWPYDDHAYGLRQSQRDADTAAAFETVRAGAPHLLATAEAQLAQLPADAVQSHWVWQLGVLRGALDRLDTLHEEWLQTRDSLPADARPGTPAFDDALAEHHAKSWSYLDDWATHGQAISDIHAAARHAPSPLAPPPTATAAPAPGRSSVVRR
ncbi:hypothetical protein [Streptomyces collinus]|uniref:hypothetical protein n=1 Tax=Streptomyces collinus TaxID=42684 RepID=UPI0037D17C29